MWWYQMQVVTVLNGWSLDEIMWKAINSTSTKGFTSLKLTGSKKELRERVNEKMKREGKREFF